MKHKKGCLFGRAGPLNGPRVEESNEERKIGNRLNLAGPRKENGSNKTGVAPCEWKKFQGRASINRFLIEILKINFCCISHATITIKKRLLSSIFTINLYIL